MPSYPGSLYARPDPIPALMSTAPTHSTILGQYGDEIEQIEAELGVNAKGSAASVSARIAAREPVIASYTPTLGGTGWVMGTTGSVQLGRYVSVDGMCTFLAAVTLGTGFAVGSAAPSLTLPVNAHSSESGLRHLISNFSDTSATSHFSGRTQIAGGLGAVNCLYTSVSGTVLVDAIPTSTLPFTWAAGDIIAAAGTYITL